MTAIERLQCAQDEIAVVMEAIRQGNALDACGRLADVVGDVLREVKALAASTDKPLQGNGLSVPDQFPALAGTLRRLADADAMDGDTHDALRDVADRLEQNADEARKVLVAIADADAGLHEQRKSEAT